MGVEYRHFLVINDPSWRPQADTAARVEAVLRQWGLGERPCRAIELATGETLEAPDAAARDPGPGIALDYDRVEGAPVERLAGPSRSDADVAERYIDRVWLVLGEDYRVHTSWELLCFDLVDPPMAGDEAIAPYETEPVDLLYDQAFPALDATSPPLVKIIIEDEAEPHLAWKQYQGYWRGALILDFNKDLPDFVESLHRLPARDFVAALAEAFRGPLVEVGEIA